MQIRLGRMAMGAVLVIGVAAAGVGRADDVPPIPGLAEASARLQAGDAAAAATILEGVVTREPRNARAWRMLGFASIKTRGLERARASYVRALELEPDLPQALYNMGVIHALRGDADQAFGWLEKAKATRKLDMTAIQTDADLATLAKDPRFTRLLPRPEDFANPFVEPVKVLREWDGEAMNDQFGWIARNLGDVDGDSVPDIVTSAPTCATGGPKAGRVYVYSTRSGRLLWTADGQPGDQLGTGVEGAGDTNADGIPDVVAGAPGGGVSRVYSGRDGKLLLTLHAEDKGDTFGRHVAGVGDADHDGHADVIVGAPTNAAGGKGAGRAYVFSGKDGHALLRLGGERAGDAFGSTVAGATIGGKTTLIVGAPVAGARSTGRVFVYEGLNAKPKFTLESDETGAALGLMFVSVLGDADADGVPDVYASDFGNAAKGPGTGRVYVHSGKDGRRLLELTGETAGEGFGIGPADAGDVDGDGHADLIVGAWQYAGAAVSGGRAYLYSGRSGALLRTFTCKVAGDTFGFDAVGMGDVDGDGTLDLLLTSAWSGIRGYHTGRMFLISSGVSVTKR